MNQLAIALICVIVSFTPVLADELERARLLSMDEQTVLERESGSPLGQTLAELPAQDQLDTIKAWSDITPTAASNLAESRALTYPAGSSDNSVRQAPLSTLLS